MKAAGNSWGARELLANRLPLAVPPAVPKEWLKSLLSHALAAANDGQYDTAYKIASKANDALPPSEVMAEQDLTTRDHFTSLTWLAGNTAMRQLGRPRDAVEMFRLYSTGAKTPQTKSKGLYGRKSQRRRPAILPYRNAI